MNDTNKALEPQADAIYHQIYSHTEMVKRLLRSFGPQELIANLDLETLHSEPTKSYAAGGQCRQGDLGFSLRGSEENEHVHVAVLIENQTRVDTMMTVRMLEYAARYLRWITAERLKKAQHSQVMMPDEVPFIMPIVFYNGLKPWTGRHRGTLNLEGDVCFKLQDLYAKGAPKSFYHHSLQLTWFLISVHDMPLQRLQKHDHVVSWLMQYERLAFKSSTRIEVAKKISQYVSQEENHWLREPVESLRKYVLLRSKGSLQSANLPYLNDLSEESMRSLAEILAVPEDDLNLPESLARYFYEESEKYKNQGLSQGLSQGLKEAVESVLETRFGEDGKKFWATELQKQTALNWKELHNQAVIADNLSSFVAYYLKSKL